MRDGAPARWRDGPLPFRFAEGTPETVKSSFERALARWSGAQCPETRDARAGRTGLRFVEREPTSDEEAAFVIAIDDDVSTRDELGLTTLDFGESTGTVKSGRIRIDRTALDDGVDLDIVLTHEVGHYVGLAHSKAEDSVMQEHYSSIRTPKLGPDDLKAVCTLYPPQSLRQLPPSCSAASAGAGRAIPSVVLAAIVLLATKRRARPPAAR